MEEEEAFRAKTKNDVGPFRMVGKKDAARRQILKAWSLLHDGEWECAITLAAAAEGQIVGDEGSTLFSMLKNMKMRARF
jgi:hypothetical protein